jgi:hypothetical protein
MNQGGVKKIVILTVITNQMASERSFNLTGFLNLTDSLGAFNLHCRALSAYNCMSKAVNRRTHSIIIEACISGPFCAPEESKYETMVLAKQLEEEDIRAGRTYSQRTPEQIARWKDTGKGPRLDEPIQLPYRGQARVIAVKENPANAGRGARTPVVIRHGAPTMRSGPIPAAITHTSRERFTLPPACLHESESREILAAKTGWNWIGHSE